MISESEDAKSKEEPTEEKTRKEEDKRRLYEWIIEGDSNFDWVINRIKYNGLRPWDKLTNNGNTVLHVAVGSSTKNHEFLKKLLEKTPKDKLLDIINSDGSSLLHVAAIGGNIEVVNILVERNPELLLAKDKEGHTPLALSVSNMHTKTSHCLFDHMKVHGFDNLSSGQNDDSGQSDEDIKTSERLLENEYDALFSGKSGEDLVVLAISCQDFRKYHSLSSKVVMSLSFYIPYTNYLKYVGLAKKIIDDYPDAILSDSDAVLTALAQNFPCELNFLERGNEFVSLIVFQLINVHVRQFCIVSDLDEEFDRIAMRIPYGPTLDRLENYADSSRGRQPLKIFIKLFLILLVGTHEMINIKNNMKKRLKENNFITFSTSY